MELKNLYKKYKKKKRAVGQFNIYNYEMIRGVARAAQKKSTPVLIGTSSNGVEIMGMEEIVSIVNFYKKKNNSLFFLNLDHGRDTKVIKKAIDLGYDGVHFDGSALNFKENLEATKEITSYAKNKNVVIEGEIELIGSEIMTDPEKAAKFVKETNIDSLAVNIGNRHGISEEGTNPSLSLEKLKEISIKAPEVYLVLHGGSGTPVKDLKKAIEGGIVKVNFATELKNAYLKKLEEVVKEKSGNDILYSFPEETAKVIQKKVEEKFKLF